MKYICRDGVEYDLSEIPGIDPLIILLKLAYDTAICADSFYFMTSSNVMSVASALRDDSDVPFIIQNDLSENLRIKDGEIIGEISRMFVD
ncbi:hypothetical protein J4476_02115 [Candidatus Woesearchaeota archaeon]|nr:hypothetical protein [Candidatus Woesearchaeota archaeon]HIH25825.1 hypothetical protein [Nanoarchaeota archaeon]